MSCDKYMFTLTNMLHASFSGSWAQAGFRWFRLCGRAAGGGLGTFDPRERERAWQQLQGTNPERQIQRGN